MSAARTASLERQTSESKVRISLDLDGTGRSDVSRRSRARRSALSLLISSRDVTATPPAAPKCPCAWPC